MHAHNTTDRWSLAKRLAFRFLFLSFVLTFASSLVSLLPWVGSVGGWLDEAVQPFYIWVGRAVFGVEIVITPTGSGDTTYGWVQFATNLALAIAGTAVWSVVDRRRPSYPWLRDGLWIAMRFVLAGAMFSYGFSKVYGLQFPEPDFWRLTSEYGQSSPMGLLWTFMGSSQPYSMFGGWMEVIGGLLLCFRRTQLAGALFTSGVMTNVFVLNLCYDVPVKLYSFQLLAMGLVIAAPDMPRLLRMFILNREAAPADLLGPWTKPVLRRVAVVTKLVWLVVTLSLVVSETASAREQIRAGSPKGDLAGSWEVIEHRIDGVELPTLGTDARRWKYLVLAENQGQQFAVATAIQGVRKAWRVERSDSGLKFRAMRPAQPQDPAGDPVVGTLEVEFESALEVAREGEKRLRLTGMLEGVRVEAACELREARDFPLMSRGFHWINEHPFNR